jgi:hypothetical protein
MTLFQRGNVIVQSYPYFPDMLAVANAIAADDHAAAAETLLQQRAFSSEVCLITRADSYTCPNNWGIT